MSGNGSVAAGPTSVEVMATAHGRQFTDAFKRRVLDDADRVRPGEIGLNLGREGLYSSQLDQWQSGGVA